MTMSRRKVLAAGTAAVASAATRKVARAQGAPARSSKDPFIYCLNTSTISGQKLDLVKQLELASKVGYQAVEPWLRDIEMFVKKGGNLKDLRKRIADLNLTIEDCIGFAQWLVDDEGARAKGLEQAKRDMDLCAQIGCKRIAAPAAGAQDKPWIDLRKAAERFRALCEVGDQFDVSPMVEVWGFSTNLTTLAEATFVAMASRHPRASVLPDVYHLYKGNSDLNGLRLLSRQCVQMIHFNDYPGMDRAKINDADRVYPGEGTAPLTQILNDLRAMGGKCVLSLELFNRQYWKLDAEKCASQGLEKMRAAVEKSLA